MPFFARFLRLSHSVQAPAFSSGSFALEARTRFPIQLRFVARLHCSRTMASEYKLKGLTSLSLSEGEKAEFEVEGVEGGKVLLVKQDGKFYATSSRCTHYGAPLAKGVLHAGGRLTCPWHGACFNVTTGEIEDAPALDPLNKYAVSEHDGGVYITGDEATIKSFSANLNISCKPAGGEHVVVVGGGSGSLGTIEGLRGGGFKGRITLITAEPHNPIDRTKLSKALLADVDKLAWRKPDFYASGSVDIVHDTVTAVDFAGKSVATKANGSVPYTKLVLATGGTARWLPLPGLKGDLQNVFVLRTVDHVKSILAAAGDTPKTIVVIGSSFIGMEVANCLAGKKHNVSVIGMETEPMERVMGATVGRIFRGLLEKTGVKFYLSASVDKATPSESDPSRVGAVLLKDGTTLPADLVIEGVGIAPETSYLRDNAAVTLLRDGSLDVDDYFRVTSLGADNDAVFAIGDIATYPYRGPGGSGAPTRIEHWNVAQNAGRTVARHINVPGAKPKHFIPVFWSALGQQLRYCGNTMAGYDDVVVQGETGPEKYGWVAWYTKGEEVVACATMGRDPVMVQVAELMRLSKVPSKADIVKGVNVLEV